MLLAFLVFELLGLTHKLPWVTASETDWATLRLLPTPVRWVVRALLLGFFLSLGPHLAFATPLLP